VHLNWMIYGGAIIVIYGGAVAAGLGCAVMAKARTVRLVNIGYGMVVSGLAAALIGVGMAVR
jgi:hypothetical protein